MDFILLPIFGMGALFVVQCVLCKMCLTESLGELGFTWKKQQKAESQKQNSIESQKEKFTLSGPVRPDAELFGLSSTS